MGRPKKYATEEERIAAQKEYMKAYREKHPEKWTIAQRKYAETHAEEMREKRKAYYAANRERFLEHSRKQAARNAARNQFEQVLDVVEEEVNNPQTPHVTDMPNFGNLFYPSTNFLCKKCSAYAHAHIHTNQTA